MDPMQRDVYSNQHISEAAALNNEANALLKKNELRDCIQKNHEAIYTAMRGVLGFDDIFPTDDPAVEHHFRQRYIDNGMMSEELVETLDRLSEVWDNLYRDETTPVSKPECGYFTSKAKSFVMEASDYLVQRNALYMGQ